LAREIEQLRKDIPKRGAYYGEVPGGGLLVKSLGIDIRHKQEFSIDRPLGSGDFVFIHFPTEISVLTKHGVETGRPGACVLYVPPHPQWYQGTGEGFSNDWFHAEGDEFERIVTELAIPQNGLFYPEPAGFIPDHLELIRREMQNARKHAGRMIRNLVENFFIEIRRSLDDAGETGISRGKSELLDKLREIRFEMEDDPQRKWTVMELAKKAGLSPSRYSVLHREFFGAGPIDDLINMRLNYAKWLLTNTKMSVSEAAFESGFSNVCHFSRIFKRRVSCPPKQYYEKIAARPDVL
jgi:AraC-like DNA-binding protein